MSSSDPTTSSAVYWPPGWSRTRLVHSSSADILDLDDNERDRMYASLNETLGTDNFDNLLAEMSANYKARLAAGKNANGNSDNNNEDDGALPPHLRAPFLAPLAHLYPDDGGSGGEWGFVAYRLLGDAVDEKQWTAFRERWDRIIDERLRNYDDVPGVLEARQRLRFRWVEKPFNDVKAVATHYRNLLSSQRPPPPGLTHSLCLAITSSSLSSVLTSALPSSASSTPSSDRKRIPFAIAIDANLGWSGGDGEGTLESAAANDDDDDDNDDDEHDFRGFFNVAVASLVDELFPVVTTDMLAPRELGVGVGPHQVWCSAGGRYGVAELEE